MFRNVADQVLKESLGLPSSAKSPNAVLGVFQEGRCGENDEPGRRGSDWTGDEKDKTRGFAEEEQKADGFGVHTPGGGENSRLTEGP